MRAPTASETPPVVVGLDVGTSGVKALAVSQDGRVVGRAERSYSPDTPRPGWSEQDPRVWADAARDALAQLTAVGRPVAGIGFSGQMHGLVALDAGLEPVHPALLWNDQRAFEQASRLEEHLGAHVLERVAGSRASAGFTAPKAIWLREHDPRAWGRARHIMLPKDYVRLVLTGEPGTDMSDASGTLLFDIAARDWSGELLDAAGIDRALLPPAGESSATLGEVRLPGGATVPAAAGAGDQAASALGLGAHVPGVTTLTIGTSGVAFTTTDRAVLPPPAGAHAFCHAAPGAWHTMGVMLSAAGSLQWFRDTLASSAGFEELMAEADQAPAGADGALFLPYLSGERTPHADPHARGAFVGLAAAHSRAHLVRALLEGVAFGLADCLDTIETDAAGGPLRVAGGATRSPLWLKIIASVLDRSLLVPAVDEGSAYGAAMLGAAAAGWTSSAQASADWPVVEHEVAPVAEWVQLYAHARETYRAAYPALRDVRQGAMEAVS